MTPDIKAAIERLARKPNCSTEFAILNGITAYKRDVDDIALILADHARLQADNARMREALGPDTVQSLQRRIAALQSRLHFMVCGDPSKSVSLAASKTGEA